MSQHTFTYLPSQFFIENKQEDTHRIKRAKHETFTNSVINKKTNYLCRSNAHKNVY